MPVHLACFVYLMKSLVLKTRLSWLCLIKMMIEDVHSYMEDVSHTALGWACERSWALLLQSL